MIAINTIIKSVIKKTLTIEKNLFSMLIKVRFDFNNILAREFSLSE